MARRAHIRLRLLAASAVLAAGLAPLLPTTAVAEGAQDAPQETVVPATQRDTYTAASLQNPSSYSGHDGAGAQGVFHSLEGAGTVWTRYSDGTSVPVARPAGSTGWYGTGSDTLAFLYADGRTDLWNAVDGTTRTVHVPAGLSRLSAYGDLVVGWRSVQDENGTAWREMHLLLPEADGTTRDVPVTGLPAGVNLGAVLGGDGDGLLFQAARNGQYLSVLVDRATGQVLSLTPPRSKVYLKAQFTTDHVVVFNVNDPTVLVYPRSDLSAAPTAVTVGGSGVNPAQDLAVVGDWLIHRPSAGTTVLAKPLSGGPEVTLLTSSSPGASAVPDGTAVMIGRTGAGQWGIQRIAPGADGSPTVTMVKALPKPTYKIQGLALDQGRLVVADPSSGYRDIYGRTVAATGTPTFGSRSSYDGPGRTLAACPVTDLGCSQLFGTAAGPVVWLERGSGQYDTIRSGGPGNSWTHSVPAGGRITDVSGRYVLYTTATEQYVYRLGAQGEGPVVTRPSGAAALDGDTLWVADGEGGSVTALDLTRKTGDSLALDSSCAPTDLQALGRWLYWNCGDGRSGVYDRTTSRSVPVPADEAKLGDGFVVTHDRAAGRLTLTTVADGTPVSRVIGDLPDTGLSQRDVRWTVDESGANAAYVDTKEQVHLVPSGVAQQPLRLSAPAVKEEQVNASEVDDRVPDLTTALLSKPAASWQLTVRDKATGKVVDGTDGGLVRGELKVGWDGVGGSGFLPNGSYDWTLSVTPADGVGTPLKVTGTVRLRHAGAVRHDYQGSPAWQPDGIGDLLTLDSSGRLTSHQGTGKGAFKDPLTGGGWRTATQVVPVGDLSGDRCNDVIVRYTSGAARLYKAGCGTELTTSTPYTTLVTSGWNAYDVLTAPGDVSGDGRPDLIARNASTGAVYLYKGTSAGKLSARVKLYDNWKTYKKVVGVGDLNGDGIGDLVAQDKSNNLYRYYGTGRGTFGTRVKLSASWGVSYNVVVGAGDITGDGRADLVARDTAGNLYRLDGTGKGTFGTRVKIGTGWQRYKGLF
ncbi:FG-GAP repeat domain-containing protein [Streptomyces sp. NPDC001002]